MKFNIVYDKPCRIRFRCGGYAFEKSQEYSIYKKLTDADFVKKAEIRSENGGILVYYKEGFRQKVIELVSGIDTRKLEIIPADPEYGITEIDRDFKDRIISVTAKKIIFKALYPNGSTKIYDPFPRTEIRDKRSEDAFKRTPYRGRSRRGVDLCLSVAKELQNGKCDNGRRRYKRRSLIGSGKRFRCNERRFGYCKGNCGYYSLRSRPYGTCTSPQAQRAFNGEDTYKLSVYSAV